ncbi:hypothetical protein SLS62_006967 [Diatrype stigma]|uniref:2,2-dialkylglycine decarboxylase n=1 Tax=Diatrype stigma TaxID=117547 RepID=A0AAN9UQM9_9PEZI
MTPEPIDTSSETAEISPLLYKNLDNDALQKEASQYLAHYGTEFLPDVICGAKGLYVYTASGRKVLDWTSEIVQTINEHAAGLDHLFSGMISPPVISLAERLCSLLPDGLDKAFFLSTGGESNEAAIKMAKVFTGKFEIVGLGASWHIVPLTKRIIADALPKPSERNTTTGPIMPGMHMLPAPNAYRSIFRKPDPDDNGSYQYDWEAELDYGWALIDQASCGSLAACIVECVQSSAGMHVLPPGYLAALKRHCERRGMLLIVDEAQTGIGRSGAISAAATATQAYKMGGGDGEGGRVIPDILTFSKTLGNGLPLSAVVTRAEIDDACAATGSFTFYTTHANDPLPAAVGNKVLEVVVRDGLVANARALGEGVLLAGLRARLQRRYACVGDVRGRGLMAGVEIVKAAVGHGSDDDGNGTGKRRRWRQPPDPDVELARRIADRAYALGVWANLSSHSSFSGTLRIAPPITSTREDIERGLEILEEAFASTSGSRPLY